MTCKLSENCTYYNIYRHKTTSRQYSLLVESYCEGQLQLMCRRKQYEEEFSKLAPDDLAPNGYLIGTHRKLKIENTRKHKRHAVKEGTCLLQEPSSKSTFSAEVIDISRGGLRLVTKVDTHVLESDSETTILKILGHTIDESPIPLTKELIKVVWKNDQIFGCAFVSSLA